MSRLSLGLVTCVTLAAAVVTAAAVPPVVWQVPAEGWGTPAADETSVYFTTRRHQVVAVDINSGRERWRTDTNEPGSYTYGYGAVVSGSIVAVGDYNVVAFNRETGAFKWRFTPQEGWAPGPLMGSVTNGLLVTGSGSGHVYAIDFESGIARWSTVVVSDENRAAVFTPVTNGDTVFVGFTEFTTPGNTGGVVALDLKTGVVRWRILFPRPADPTLGTNSAGGPILYDNFVIASSGDGTIYALDRESGEIRWSIPRLSNLPQTNIIAPDRDYRALAISGSTLVASSLTGVIAGFDLGTRDERWRFHDPWLTSSTFRITADHRSIYLPFFSGELVALDAATGAEQWRIGDWKAGFLWMPLPWKDRLFVCATRDGLFALNLAPSQPQPELPRRSSVLR